MEKYEKTIGLKTIYLTLVRRFHIILVLFIPIALGSFIVTNLILKKTYQSTSMLTKTASFTSATYQTIQLSAKKDSMLKSVVDSLKEKNIHHLNGSEITTSEVYSGLSFSNFSGTNSSPSISLYFQSYDSTVVQSILSELSASLVNDLKPAPGAADNGFVGLTISKEASKAVKNSKENQYFLIALAAGAVISLGIPFVYEIISDELYDADDVKALGCDAFELKASGK